MQFEFEPKELNFMCSNCHKVATRYPDFVCYSCNGIWDENKLQGPEEQAAIIASFDPRALPLDIQHAFGLYRSMADYSDSEIVEAIADFTENRDSLEQVLAWFPDSSVDTNELRMLRRWLNEAQEAVDELGSEMERRLRGLPFAGSTTFDRAAYIERMRNQNIRNWWKEMKPFETRQAYYRREEEAKEVWRRIYYREHEDSLW